MSPITLHAEHWNSVNNTKTGIQLIWTDGQVDGSDGFYVYSTYIYCIMVYGEKVTGTCCK